MSLLKWLAAQLSSQSLRHRAVPARRHRRLVVEQFEQRRLLTTFATDDEFWIYANETLSVIGINGNDGCDAPEDWEPGCTGSAGSTSHGTLTKHWNEEDPEEAIAAAFAFTYTPDANFVGDDSFGYSISGYDGSASATVTIHVLTPFQIVGDEYEVSENDELIVGAPGVKGNDTSEGGVEAISVGLVSGPLHGSLGLNGDGSFTYTPDAAFSGDDSFVYSGDNGVAYAEATVTIHVIMDTIVEVNDDEYELDEDDELVVNAPGVKGNDTSAVGGAEAITLAVVTEPLHGTLTLNSDGSFEYTPDADFNGADSFVYSGYNGFCIDWATVIISVHPVNDAPTANGDAYTTGRNTALNIGGAGVLGNDTDLEFNALSVVSITGIAAGTVGMSVPTAHGSVTINANGSFVYTPNTGFEGIDSFIYAASDGGLSASATVTITVGLPPVAADDRYEYPTSGPLQVSNPGVLANDSDDSPFKFAIFDQSGPENGTLSSASGDGGFTYTANPGFHGVDRFSYRVTDGSFYSTATVFIAVNNTAPVATDGFVGPIQIEVGVTFSSDLRPRASDPDGDPLVFAVVTQPERGTVEIAANGDFVYVPVPYENADTYQGLDTFTFKVWDGYAYSNVAEASIVFRPNAVLDEYQMYKNEELDTLLLSLPSALENDMTYGPGLTVQTAPAYTRIVSVKENGVERTTNVGTLQMSTDGHFVYVPPTDFTGEVIIEYTIQAGSGGNLDTGTINILVLEP